MKNKILAVLIVLGFAGGLVGTSVTFADDATTKACNAKGVKAGDTVRVDGKFVKCPKATIIEVAPVSNTGRVSATDAARREVEALNRENRKRTDPGGPKPDVPELGTRPAVKLPGAPRSGSGDPLLTDSNARAADFLKSTPLSAIDNNKPVDQKFGDRKPINIDRSSLPGGNPMKGSTDSDVAGQMGAGENKPRGIAAQGKGAISTETESSNTESQKMYNEIACEPNCPPPSSAGGETKAPPAPTGESGKPADSKETTRFVYNKDGKKVGSINSDGSGTHVDQDGTVTTFKKGTFAGIPRGQDGGVSFAEWNKFLAAHPAITKQIAASKSGRGLAGTTNPVPGDSSNFAVGAGAKVPDNQRNMLGNPGVAGGLREGGSPGASQFTRSQGRGSINPGSEGQNMTGERRQQNEGEIFGSQSQQGQGFPNRTPTLTEACKDKKPGDTVKVDGKDVKCP